MQDNYRINIKKLNYLCSNEDSNQCIVNDVNTSLKNMIDRIKHILNLVTTKTNLKNKNRKNKEWITPAIINSINIKEKLYKMWKTDPLNDELKNNYKKYSNKLCNIIKFCKINFEKNKIQSFKNNNKKIWQFIKDKIGSTQINQKI